MAENENEDPSAPVPPPSIARLVLPLLGLTTSLALAGLLIATFWMGRPVNLAFRTQDLADMVEESLLKHHIPQANILRSDPVVQRDSQRKPPITWTLHAFQVTVPARLNNASLREFLTSDMSTYAVRVMNAERDRDTPDVEKLAFYLGDQQFIEMSLVRHPEEAQTVYRSDLRSKSDQLADLADSVLANQTAGGTYNRNDVVSREDLNSYWNYTTFNVTLPPGMTVGALKEFIDARLNLPDARVETGPNLFGDVDLQISLGIRPCVGMYCTEQPGSPEARPTPIDLDSVLGGGILGSEPTEEPMSTPVRPPLADPPPPEAPAEATEAPAEEEAAPMVETPVVMPPAARNPDEGPKRMAIIIDDGGNNRSDSDRYLALDTRLTLAVLPNTTYGTYTAEEGANRGFEIMLHMPMETDSGSEEAVEGTLFTAMGKKEILKLTNNALDQYPAVVGLNNHTGSKFTSNAKKMAFVMEVLKKRDLFFIDSYTINTSVGYETARKAGIPAARRDVFLDNEADEASIRAQFEELVEKTLKNGQAIGIGHFQKPNTAKVLAAEIPRLAEKGITLVHASELVQ